MFKFSVLNIKLYLNFVEFLPFGSEVELNSVHIAGQGGGPDQQDDEDGVGEQGGEVHQLEHKSLY